MLREGEAIVGLGFASMEKSKAFAVSMPDTHSTSQTILLDFLGEVKSQSHFRHGTNLEMYLNSTQPLFPCSLRGTDLWSQCLATIKAAQVQAQTIARSNASHIHRLSCAIMTGLITTGLHLKWVCMRGARLHKRNGRSCTSNTSKLTCITRANWKTQQIAHVVQSQRGLYTLQMHANHVYLARS